MVSIQIMEGVLHAVEMPDLVGLQILLEFNSKESVVKVSLAHATWEDVLFPPVPSKLAELKVGEDFDYKGHMVKFEGVIDQEEAGVYAEVTYY